MEELVILLVLLVILVVGLIILTKSRKKSESDSLAGKDGHFGDDDSYTRSTSIEVKSSLGKKSRGDDKKEKRSSTSLKEDDTKQLTKYAYMSRKETKLCPSCDAENDASAVSCFVCGKPTL